MVDDVMVNENIEMLIQGKLDWFINIIFILRRTLVKFLFSLKSNFGMLFSTSAHKRTDQTPIFGLLYKILQNQFIFL